MTDEAKGYLLFRGEMKGHETVVHARHQYVRDGWTTNAAENYFSQLKRSIDGTNHHVSKEHLPRYLAEYDFRYSTARSPTRSGWSWYRPSNNLTRVLRSTWVRLNLGAWQTPYTADRKISPSSAVRRQAG